MKYIWGKIENYLLRFTIQKKMLMIYFFCIVCPLIITDSFIIYTVFHSEYTVNRSETKNIADAVQYRLFYEIDTISRVANSIAENKYIYDFLEEAYHNPLHYFEAYQQLFRNALLNSKTISRNAEIVLYTNNETVVSGGHVRDINRVKQSSWYKELQKTGYDEMLYFGYGDGESISQERYIVFIKRMKFYGESDIEKIMKIKINYHDIIRSIQNMNYEMPIYICEGNKILLSNDRYNSLSRDYKKFYEKRDVEYVQKMELYNSKLQIYMLKAEKSVIAKTAKKIPQFFLFILINLILPLFMMVCLNHSLTERIRRLSQIFKRVEDENLIEVELIRGSDEISELMRNYNKMVRRLNSLIQNAYKNKIREHEMTVARQKAEILALYSQINPHFLFNALESIRMHSIIRKEEETAQMIEKLAIMQRKYVNWENEMIDIYTEMEIVKDYLDLQKYRFGDKLSYGIEVQEDCYKKNIPKFTIVTFVENACIHGIERKSSSGWIFVRVYQKNMQLCIEVEDTGIGMTEDEIISLQEKIDVASIEMLQNKKGIGMINACLRLKLLSNNRVNFKIEGEKGVGVIITICLPLS